VDWAQAQQVNLDASMLCLTPATPCDIKFNVFINLTLAYGVAHGPHAALMLSAP
jgi:hypothetical protein